MTDKVTSDQLDEFFEQMDRTAKFYQRAVIFLAVEQIAEMQDTLEAQIVSQPKPLFWQKVRTIAQNLIRRLTPCSPERVAGKEEDT
jgi:hypothetical protein